MILSGGSPLGILDLHHPLSQNLRLPSFLCTNGRVNKEFIIRTTKAAQGSQVWGQKHKRREREESASSVRSRRGAQKGSN